MGLTTHATHHTSHVTRHTSRITRHTSHVTRHTSHITHHTSHVTRHTSHVTRHTSHVTRHTSRMYERLPPQSVAPDTEVREFDYWRTVSIRQDFINTKVRLLTLTASVSALLLQRRALHVPRASGIALSTSASRKFSSQAISIITSSPGVRRHRRSCGVMPSITTDCPF